MAKNEEPDEAVASPPFPADAVTADGLYDYMTRLAAFVASYAEASNRRSLEADRFNKHRPLVTRKAHNAMPLVRLHAMLLGLRTLRAGWDRVVRENENRWNSDPAIAARHGLLAHANAFLDQAYLSDEVMEAKHHERCKHREQSVLTQIADIFDRAADREDRGGDDGDDEDGD